MSRKGQIRKYRDTAYIAPTKIYKLGKVRVPNYMADDVKALVELDGVKVNIVTGEVMTMEDEITPIKFPRETEIILDNFRNYVISFPPEIGDPIMKVVNRAISLTSEEAVAGALKDMPEDFHTYLNYIRYGNYERAIGMFSTNLLNYLERHFEVTDWIREELEDAIDYVMTDEDVDTMKGLKIIQKYAKQAVNEGYSTYNLDKLKDSLKWKKRKNTKY